MSGGTPGAGATRPRHVVFGAGAVGLALVESLVARGEQGIRVVHRSGSARVPDGVEVVAGDARDPAFTTAVTEGARVVYQVLNPAYDRWAAEFPALQDGVLAAAEHARARLVCMENVYLYGRPDGRPLTEDRPLGAPTRKGAVRARMAADLLAAHAAGRVEVAVGRASDYYGPRAGAQSNLGDGVFRAALAGGTARVLGDPDQPHTYTFVPDVAEGLAVLGEHPDAPGRVWHLPNDPSAATTRDLVRTVFGLAGHGAARVRSTPWPLLRAVGLVNPTVRELVEMRYEFEEPFLVDGSRITRELGVRATPYAEGLARTLGTYR